MKIRNRPALAFSLIEVTLALGVAAFCLVAVFGLLPVGVNSNQSAIQQTAAASLATRIASDLRAAQTTVPPSAQNSPLYQIPIPKPGDPVSNYTLFLAEDGTLANAAGGNADATKNPRYRATLTLTAPTASQRTATSARLFLTWPALADSTATTPPKNYAGSLETVIALDRN